MVSYEDVVKLAEKLPAEEQNKLIAHLQTRQRLNYPTREDLIKELEMIQITSDHVESLYGRFANPNVPEVSEEEFHAYLRDIGREWEQELDEFFGDTD